MKEQTKAEKSGSKNYRRLSTILYLATWLLCVAWFWLGRDGGGWIMAYTILVYWVMLPVVSMVSGFLLARGEDLGKWIWVPLLALGAMNISVPIVTFVLGTAFKVVNVAVSQVELLLMMIPGAVGLGLGTLFRKMNWSMKIAGICLLLLMVLCYLALKSFGGPIWRFQPILDIPALVILVAAICYILRQRKRHAA